MRQLVHITALKMFILEATVASHSVVFLQILSILTFYSPRS